MTSTELPFWLNNSSIHTNTQGIKSTNRLFSWIKQCCCCFFLNHCYARSSKMNFSPREKNIIILIPDMDMLCNYDFIFIYLFILWNLTWCTAYFILILLECFALHGWKLGFICEWESFSKTKPQGQSPWRNHVVSSAKLEKHCKL